MHPEGFDATADDVEALLARDWDEHARPAVRDLLRSVDHGPHAEPRVHVAILQLADGDWDRLASMARLATSDPRDVLVAAFYPDA